MLIKSCIPLAAAVSGSDASKDSPNTSLNGAHSDEKDFSKIEHVVQPYSPGNRNPVVRGQSHCPSVVSRGKVNRMYWRIQQAVAHRVAPHEKFVDSMGVVVRVHGHRADGIRGTSCSVKCGAKRHHMSDFESV